MSDPKVVLFGRVHPERTYVGFTNEAVTAMVRSLTGQELFVDLLINNGQIIATIRDTQGLSVLDLRNMAYEISQHIVDCIGWELSCSYTVEISAGAQLSDESVTPQLFGFDVSIPALGALSRTEESRSILSWMLSGQAGELRPLFRALADIRQAGLQPGDTPFHCFRAVEALMYHFERNPRKGRPRLCEALRIDDRWIKEKLEVPGGMLRHGGVRHVLDSERASAISAAAEVISRFIVLQRRGLARLPEGEFPILRAEPEHEPPASQ